MFLACFSALWVLCGTGLYFYKLEAQMRDGPHALGRVKRCHREGQSVRKLCVLRNDRVAGKSTVAMTTL